MCSYLHVELNAFAITILVIMMYGRIGDRAYPLEQKFFNRALVANALTLVCDMLVRISNGALFPGSHVLLVASVNLYYFLNPLVTFSCLIYCDYKIHGSMRRLNEKMRYYVIPLLFAYTVFAVNGATGWFYGVNAANVYVRGQAFALIPLTMVAYPVWIEILTMRDRRECRTKTERDEVTKLSRYLIVPLICLGIQIATRGLQLVWIATVLSFVMIYINIQNRQIYTDEITDINNRRQIARAYVRMTESLGASKRLFAMMIDADDFKQMNDSYGHAYGDAMLVQMAHMLEAICAPSRDFLARMGGDEFVILATRERGEEFNLDAAISMRVAAMNTETEAKCPISLSCGLAEYGVDKIDSLDALLSKADREMYRNKAARKQSLKTGIDDVTIRR